MKAPYKHFPAALLFLLLCLHAPARADDGDCDMPPRRIVPFRTDAGLTKAETQISEEHYAQAIDTLGGVIARHPVNADAYTYLGYAYRKLGDDAKALENFRRAVQVDPQHLGANKYLADV